MGEGLSILAAQTLHPAGYYATGSGPRIGAWLNGSRPDWISTSEGTDTNNQSYGCAVLFLNYLRYQLGFSFRQIIAAAGPFQLHIVARQPLGAVFQALTKRPAASAYSELIDLLKGHIPAGTPFPVVSDNLFPLNESNRRRVSFTYSEQEVRAAIDPEVRLVERRAGPMCPPNAYSYHNVNVDSLLTVSGRSVGFASPKFTWSVNGVPLTSGRQARNIPMSATDTRPGIGEPAVPANVTVTCDVGGTGFTSTLSISNQNYPGNGELRISLRAVESLIAADAPTTYSEDVTLLTRRYAMSGAWARDVERCNLKSLSDSTLAVKSMARRLVEDLNRPNPAPGLIRALASAVRRYVETLDEATGGGSPGLDISVADALSDLAPPLPLPLAFHDPVTGLRILSTEDGERASPTPAPATDAATYPFEALE